MRCGCPNRHFPDHCKKILISLAVLLSASVCYSFDCYNPCQIRCIPCPTTYEQSACESVKEQPTETQQAPPESKEDEDWAPKPLTDKPEIQMGTPGPITKPVIEKPKEGTGHIRLLVPQNAQVYINDRPTSIKGTARNFYSIDLKPGRLYGYRIKVVYDGQQSSQSVLLADGDSKIVNFQSVEKIAQK
jgi:uncharacterized protein (TIGR03000 family)